MKKISKKIISGFMALVTVISMFQPLYVSAVENTAYDAYANEMACEYAEMTSLYSGEQISLSQGYEIYNDSNDNNRIYFVFNGNECVGELIVTYNNNEFWSNYMQNEIEDITTALSNEVPFYVCAVDKSLLFCTENQALVFDGPEVASGYSVNRMSSTSYNVNDVFEMEKLELKEIEVNENVMYNRTTYAYGNTSTAEYGKLEVPVVKNSTVDGVGICWAATVSSIAAYRTGDTALSAKTLYDNLDDKYLGSPTGNVTWVKRAFSYYGLDYTYKASGTNYAGVKACIQDERPIYASITDGEVGHAVVICGYQSAQGGYYYYEIMDPNRSSTVLVKVSSTSTNFTYTHGAYTYTTWRRRFY